MCIMTVNKLISLSLQSLDYYTTIKRGIFVFWGVPIDVTYVIAVVTYYWYTDNMYSPRLF